MKRLPCALLLLAMAAPASHAAEGWKPFSAKLAAHESFEECMHLERDDAPRYQWKSDAPVDFNIHYHEGSEAIYPTKRTAMRGDGGAFKPKVAQDYCWMWTAREKPARVDGQVELPRPR